MAPSVPSPSTWSSGPVLVRSLRGDVTNAVQFLASRPQFFGQNTLGTAVATATQADVPLNVTLVDNWNGYAYGTAVPYYVQAPGYYLVNGGVAWAYSAGTAHQFVTGLSGTTGGTAWSLWGPLSPNCSVAGALPQVTDLVLATATGAPGGTGDYIQLDGAQWSGGSLDLGSAPPFCPYLQLRWVAAQTGTAGLPVPANAAFPVPPDYVTSAWLNANVRDAISFLAYPPIARAHFGSGSPSLASAAFPSGESVAPVLNTVDIDNYEGFSDGVYTAPVDGVYLCYQQVNTVGSSGAMTLSAGFSINGGTTQWCATGFSTSSSGLTQLGQGAYGRRRFRLNAGDTITPMASQDTGSAVAYYTYAGAQTRMIVVWESA